MYKPVVSNQSWTDLAVQYYGNVDAVFALIDDNAGETEIDIAAACTLQEVWIRSSDPLRNEYVINRLADKTIATLK